MLKTVEFFEIREVNKGEYFLHEGEPSKFFAGLIKGKISFRKSKIINRDTNELVYKHLYKVSLLRKPTIKIKTKGSKSITLNPKDLNFADNEYNEKLKKIKNNLNLRRSREFLKKNHRFSVKINWSTLKSQMSLMRNKYSTKQEYRIIKENFDPQKYIVKEEELFQASAGYCFGEWALIYNQPRSASVVALEDCVFFILDEAIFSRTFLKCVNNSEHKKKKFVIENLFPFNILNERQSSLYKNIVPINCERNQIVFNEGDKSDKIYLIYLGTFILEKKYKHKNFSVLSLEKGCIVGLESIFEGEDSKYKCTLKLTSYDDLGLIFSCSVNKLVPFIINKMKERFKKNYLLFLKSSEEFYLNNINISEKMFFKKKEIIIDEEEKTKQQRHKSNRIKKSRYLSFNHLNIINENNNNNSNNDRFYEKDNNYNKRISFEKMNKYNNNIKSKINVDIFPYLLKNSNDSKNNLSSKKLNTSNKDVTVTFIKNNKDDIIKLQINNGKNDNKSSGYNNNDKNNFIFRTVNNKRKNTFSRINKQRKEKQKEIIKEKDEKDEIDKSIEGEKSIENYKKKKNIIEKNKINELLSFNNSSNNNNESNTERTERINMIGNAISTCEMSNANKLSRDQDNIINIINDKSSYKTIKSSYKTNEGKLVDNSTNCDFTNTNNTNYSISRKEKLKKHNKKKLGLLTLKIRDNNNYKYNSKIILTKRIENTYLNLTPVKDYKNRINVNIQKYVNYLLSNEKEPEPLSPVKKNLSPFKSRDKDCINISEEKKNYKTSFNRSRNMNNCNLEYKTINGSHLKFLTNDIFTFNSGKYNLPLMTQNFI